MAADCAHELKKYNVAMISLWPGAVKTEKMIENVLGKIFCIEKSMTMLLQRFQEVENLHITNNNGTFYRQRISQQEIKSNV